MGSTAARWEGWRNRGGVYATPSPGIGGGGTPGTPILVDQFGGRLYLSIEIAWGAVLNQDPATWSWTDVTPDVQAGADKTISVTVGAQDETSTAGPADCTLTLDNRGNKYTANPLGLNWPNVKRSTPLRIRAFLDGVPTVLFQGYVASFQPGWDHTGNYAITTVNAKGLLQRLGQGSVPAQSALRMAIVQSPSLVAYWPMEDESIVTGFAPANPADAQLGISGAPQTHSYTGFPGSDSLPLMKGAYGWGNVPPHTYTGVAQVRFLVAWPASTAEMPDAAVVLSLWTFGSAIVRWDIQYKTGGNLAIAGYDNGGALQYVSALSTIGLDGQLGRLSFSVSQSGSDLALQWQWLKMGDTVPTTFTDIKLGNTIVGASAVELNRFFIGSDTLALGHIEVSNAIVDLATVGAQLNGFDTETGDARITRLLGYQDVTAPTVYGDVTAIGPQQPDNALNLLREVEATDHGLLADGLGPSVNYYARHYLENRTAALTLDVSTGVLAGTLEPHDDDQQLRNSWTATQRSGAAYTYVDQAGPLGVGNVGLFSDSVTINAVSTAVASGIRDAASWRVHESTVQGYRYPTLQFAFHRAPQLLVPWLASGLQARVDLTNIALYAAQMPVAAASVAVRGYTYTINKFLWSVQANCAPYDPWSVAVAGASQSDPDPNLMRGDTPSSVLTAEAPPGATTLTVGRSGTTVALWTTDSGDFPMTVNVGDLPITVTGISSLTSPQTFTVDPATVTKTLTTGSTVSLWKPPVLAM